MKLKYWLKRWLFSEYYKAYQESIVYAIQMKKLYMFFKEVYQENPTQEIQEQYQKADYLYGVAIARFAVYDTIFRDTTV